MPNHGTTARRYNPFMHTELIGLHGLVHLPTNGEAKGVGRGGVGVVVGDAEGAAAGHRRLAAVYAPLAKTRNAFTDQAGRPSVFERGHAGFGELHDTDLHGDTPAKAWNNEYRTPGLPFRRLGEHARRHAERTLERPGKGFGAFEAGAECGIQNGCCGRGDQLVRRTSKPHQLHIP